MVRPNGTVSWAILRSLLIVVILLVDRNIVYGGAGEPIKQSEDVFQGSQDEGKHTQTGEVKLNKEYFKGYITDTEDILTSPARWEKSDWITASIMTGIAAGLYVNDQKIKDWVQRNKNTTTTDIVRNAQRIGTVSVGALGVLYLYGYATDSDKAQKTVLLSVESFVITGLLVQTLKFATHRHRPYTGDPYNTWDGPSFDNNTGHTSFPSGDASSAFAIATVVATEYDNYVIVPPLAYGVATAIALGRVHNNGHWSSDVFVASAIGYFTGKAVVKSHSSEAKDNLTLIPVTDGKNVDLLLTYRF